MNIERRQNLWWVELLQGIAAIILGLFLVTAPGLALTVLVTFLGAYWLVRGVFAIVEIFTGYSAVSWIWLLILGILGIVAGLIVLRHPFYSAVLVPALIVILLGIDAIIMGLINFIRSFTGSGAWAGIIGVLDVIIGVILLAAPLRAVLVLPIVLGVLALIAGVSLIVLAVRNRGTAPRIMEQRRAA